MENLSKFNQSVWEELLKTKDIKNLSIREISRRFNLPYDVAFAYKFTLTHKEQLIGNAEALKKINEFSKKNKLLIAEKNDLLNEMKYLSERISFLDAISLSKKVEHSTINISKVNMSVDENTAISLMSDWHIEETVKKEVVNGINEYNLDIAKKRITFLFKRLLFVIDSLRKGGWKIDNLVLAFLGDLINGYIHEEYVENNSLSPVEASILLQDLLISGINFLNSNGNFKKIIVIMQRGNHGRTSIKKKYATGYKNSYEWLIYNNVKNYFKDKPGFENVEFIIPMSEFSLLQIYDKKWVFSHGDHFNYRGGVGGIMIPFKGWIYKMMQIIPADKYAIGHWHTTFNLPDGISNGSVVGYSPYAIGKGFAPEPPQQQLQIQDSKRGFTINSPIILEDW